MMRVTKFNFLLTTLLIVLLTACENNNVEENKQSSTGILIDIDGNNYKTVKIGDQIQLAENYKCTRLKNGVPISDAIPCDYNTNYISTYGLLYDSSTINNTEFCPDGWRVPTKDDYIKMLHSAGLKDSTDLESYFPSYTLIDGEKYQFWNYDDRVKENKILYTNKSGFDVRAGGYEYYTYKTGNWSFSGIGNNTKFFATNTTDKNISSHVYIYSYYVYIVDVDMLSGSHSSEHFYVRLIKK